MILPVLGRLGPAGRMVAFFLAGALTALVAVLIAVAVTRQNLPAPQPSAASTTVSPSPSSASRSIDPHAGNYEHDHGALNDEKPQWEPAVLGFAKNFTNTEGRNAAQWRERLTPYVAPAVHDQLADVEPTKIATGRYDSYELLETSSYQIAAKINYREGWALVLYVTSDGERWKITAYDKFEE